MLGALCFAGCNKEEMNPENSGRTITVNATSAFNDEAETKTSMSLVGGVYKPSWVEGDVLGLYTSVAGNNNRSLTVAAADINSGNVATFHGTIVAAPEAADYTFYTYYPKSAWQNYTSTSNIKLTIPTEQHPTATSFDPAADILLAEPKTIHIEENATSADIVLRFRRTVSVVKFTFSDFDGVAGTEKINKLTFTLNEDASTTNYLTGRVKVNLEESTMESYNSSSYGFPNAIAMYSPSDAPALSSANVFVVVAPFILHNEKTMTIRIETDDHIITKTMTASSDNSFKAGIVTPINLKLDKDLSNCTIENSISYTSKTIAEVRALGTSVDNISETWKIRGIVMSDRNTNMDSKSIVLQDGIAVNSGITIRTSTAHTYDKGDDLEVIVTGGSLSQYNGLLQLTPASSAEIVRKETNVNLYEPKLITVIDLKTGNYESMYVKIDATQVTKPDCSGNLYNSVSYGKVNMETADNTFLMYINSSASNDFKNNPMPTGNGNLCGIAYVNNTTYQVLPQSAADISGLTGTRFVSYGTPTLTGKLKKETELSGCYITIPVYDLPSPTNYKVSVEVSGAGAAGINPVSETTIKTNDDGNLIANITGTPTAEGAVSFVVTVKNMSNATVCSGTIASTVLAANYVWNLASGDLGTITEASTSTTKGLDPLVWTLAPTWKTSTIYFGFDSTKGVQIGKSNNPATSYVLATTYADATPLTKIRVNASTASSGVTKLSVKVNGTLVGSEQTLTSSAADYDFALSSPSSSSNIEITLTNTGMKAEYLKSIMFF